MFQNQLNIVYQSNELTGVRCEGCTRKDLHPAMRSRGRWKRVPLLLMPVSCGRITEIPRWTEGSVQGAGKRTILFPFNGRLNVIIDISGNGIFIHVKIATEVSKTTMIQHVAKTIANYNM
jgi:hypothetical protein